MHEREYKRIRLAIDAEHKKKLEALDLVYSMSAKNGNAGSSTRVKGDLAKAIVSAVQQIQGIFNVRAVEDVLRAEHPALAAKRATISNTLKRMEGKEIEQIEKGSGKKASTYRRRAAVG
jgi:hypothetical protein